MAEELVQEAGFWGQGELKRLFGWLFALGMGCNSVGGENGQKVGGTFKLGNGGEGSEKS